MNLPGIPASDSVALADFSISFWANLYSGIISGVVTGIIVAAVILVVQHFIDNRRNKSLNQRELELFRRKLRSAFSIEGTLVIASALGSEPHASRVITKLMELNPIETWQRISPEDSIFGLLNTFIDASTDFTTKAGNLDSKINHAMRVYNASQGRIAANDHAYRSYLFGRLHDLPDEQILPHIDLSASSLSGLQMAYTFLSEHEAIRPLIEDFKRSRAALISSMEAFRNC